MGTHSPCPSREGPNKAPSVIPSGGSKLTGRHMTGKDFVRVLEYSRLGLEFNSRVIYLLPWEISALAHLGQMDEARSMAERFVALDPNASIRKLRKVYERIRVASETLWHPLYEGLRKAGVPE
jgi:hypothetical protein